MLEVLKYCGSIRRGPLQTNPETLKNAFRVSALAYTIPELSNPRKKTEFMPFIVALFNSRERGLQLVISRKL